MKNLLSISILVLLFVTCKTNQVKSAYCKQQKNIVISYCKIVDSLRYLAKYDYNLVKSKTIFILSDYEDSEQRLKEVEAKGLRGVIMGRVEDPYEIDSIRYTLNYFLDAHNIFRKQIKDSLLNSNNNIPTNEDIEIIAKHKLANEHCFEEDMLKK